MADFPFDIVGFDLDGTLFDTSLELAASLNHALASIGRAPFAPDKVKTLVGMGTRTMLTLGLEQSGEADEAMVKALHPILVEHYEANLGSNCPAFPGLIPTLDALAMQNVTLAIVTNKFEFLATRLINNLGMTDRFVTVIGGDTMGRGNGKPKADPILEMIRRCRGLGGSGRAAYVGDSIHDVHAARAAGIPCVAVAFGFLQQPAADLGADAVIDHYHELIPALHALA